MVIIDEIHEITNPIKKTVQDSGRYKGMMQLKDIPFKIGMSGTNIKNSKTELYKKIVKKTGWTINKVYRSSTRP